MSRLAASGGVLVFGLLGCAQILGLEEWPAESAGSAGTGGAGSGGTETGSTSAGGMGGGGSGSGGAGGSAGSTSSSTTTTSSSMTSAGTGTTGHGGEGGHGTCSDGISNGLETGVDCGGDSCSPCPEGDPCDNDADCISAACGPGQVCIVAEPSCAPVGPDPFCNDCIQNGVETDIDCGGEHCLPCGSNKACAWDGDCLSSQCDAVTNRCLPGVTGTPCREAEDCSNNVCLPGGCWVGHCCQ